MAHRPVENWQVRVHFATKALKDGMNLVIREDAIVDIPVLYINLTVWGIRDAINGDLDLFGALGLCIGTDGLGNFLDWYDASEDIGAGSESDDTGFTGN